MCRTIARRAAGACPHSGATSDERPLGSALRNYLWFLVSHFWLLSEALASLLFLFHFNRHRHPPSGFGKSRGLPLLRRGVIPPFVQEQVIALDHLIKNLTYWHLWHHPIEPVCKILLSNRFGSSHEPPDSFFFYVKHNIPSEAFAVLLFCPNAFGTRQMQIIQGVFKSLISR